MFLSSDILFCSAFSMPVLIFVPRFLYVIISYIHVHVPYSIKNFIGILNFAIFLIIDSLDLNYTHPLCYKVTFYPWNMAKKGTWIQTGRSTICSLIPDPTVWGARSAVVLANLKDHINEF